MENLIVVPPESPAAFLELQQLLPVKKSQSGKYAIPSARVLHHKLEPKTPYSIWFPRRVEEYGFKEGIDFLTKKLESTGGRPEMDAALTLDMAKELAMVERTDKGRIMRQYFIWAENKLREVVTALPAPQLPDFSNPSAAARAWADAHDATQKALAEAQQAQQQLIEAQPKVAFFDAVAVAKNSVPMATAAKVLKMKGVGRNKLFQMLKTDNILQTNNEPLQRYIDAGYFEVEPQPYLAGKNGEKGPRIGCTTRVTGHGLEWLTQKYKAA